MSLPKILQARKNGEFFELTDEYCEQIDHEKHEQFLRDEEAKEEE